MKEIKTIVIAAAVSVIASACILAFGLSTVARPDRTVTVRGLAEKEVDADIAVWPLSFTLGGNDLAVLQKNVMTAVDSVKAYLAEYGLDGSDYTVQAPSITDNSVNPYIDRNADRYTYLAKNVILVRSSKVDKVKAAHADSLKLMGNGIAVSQDYDSKISYEFTGLNEIKPAMIVEATQNARLAAEQFARDSGSKVGKIKRATQGLFSIDNLAVGLEEKKNVRVVTTVEYLIK